MASLEEHVEWILGIYQLETTDAVMGGANGIDNLQAKQLACRTLYLREVHDTLVKRVQEVANSIPVVPVHSVNGRIGDVHLTAADINALTKDAALNEFLPASKQATNGAVSYDVGTQVNFGNIRIQGQPLSRFIVSQGANAHGWYQIYNDGFKRVGHKWQADKPLHSDNPTGCAVIPFPIAFSRDIISVHASIETTTPGAEIINYAVYELSKIGLTAATVNGTEFTAMANFACSYTAEGY